MDVFMQHDVQELCRMVSLCTYASLLVSIQMATWKYLFNTRLHTIHVYQILSILRYLKIYVLAYRVSVREFMHI